jgi:hypothetical protein
LDWFDIFHILPGESLLMWNFSINVLYEHDPLTFELLIPKCKYCIDLHHDTSNKCKYIRYIKKTLNMTCQD